MAEFYEFNGMRWYTALDNVFLACYGKKVFLYGIGEYADFLSEQLKKNKIEIHGYIVTRRVKKEQNYNGIPVFQPDELELNDDYIIVLCSEKYNDEMAYLLEKFDFNNYVSFFVDIKIPIISLENNDIENEEFFSNMEDGLLRIRITNRCPGKCDFCGQRMWPDKVQKMEMNPDWYFKYLRPFYEVIKVALITGGDSFYAKKSYEFMSWLSENYPQITIMTESIGITFSEKFRKLACDNLFLTHFSLNASNSDIFTSGCWKDGEGIKAYDACVSNVQRYIDLLRRKERLCFAPNFSMVINRYTAGDIIPFMEMALRMKASYVIYYFDYRENNMEEDYFKNPQIGRAALKTLMELERVLAGKVYIEFRLWVPLLEISSMERVISEESLDELSERYSVVLELAKDRSIIKENDNRNLIRRKFGKKELTVEEDLFFTLQTHTVKGCNVCKAAWKVVDVYPSGRLDFCSWHVPTLYLEDFIEDGGLDCNKIINSVEFRQYRSKMMAGNYEGCMKCCPIIKRVMEE